MTARNGPPQKKQRVAEDVENGKNVRTAKGENVDGRRRKPQARTLFSMNPTRHPAHTIHYAPEAILIHAMED